MMEDELIPAKAITLEEQSDSIVVSFGSEWYEQLLAQRFSVVIRKRVPKATRFKWLYFHINSPIGAICARAPIVKIFTATTKQAVALRKKIHLPAAEITAYIGEGAEIGCYELGAVEFAVKPVTTLQLAEKIIYHPPQSFFIISKAAQKIIDQMAEFKPSWIIKRVS